MTDGAVTILDELDCVEREVRMRERTYPRWVASGKMTQAQATREIARMKAVRARLRSAAASGQLL